MHALVRRISHLPQGDSSQRQHRTREIDLCQRFHRWVVVNHDKRQTVTATDDSRTETVCLAGPERFRNQQPQNQYIVSSGANSSDRGPFPPYTLNTVRTCSCLPNLAELGKLLRGMCRLAPITMRIAYAEVNKSPDIVNKHHTSGEQTATPDQ